MYLKFKLFIYFLFTNLRVFCDRLIDEKDRESFIGILSENLGSFFDQTFHNICPSKQSPIFGNFFINFVSDSFF
jgi:hypothetical protein